MGARRPKPISTLTAGCAMVQLQQAGAQSRGLALAVPCLRCVGLVAAGGSAAAAEQVLTSGLEAVVACVRCQHAALQQEGAWVLSNLGCLSIR